MNYFTDRDAKITYEGLDKEDAENEFNSSTTSDLPEGDQTHGGVALLSSKKNTYKFIYGLDLENEETIEDFPIEDFYKDSDFYKLITEGEYDVIDSLTIENISKLAAEEKLNIENEIKLGIRNYLNSISESSQLAAFLGSTFYSLIPYKDGYIQARVADHHFKLAYVRLGMNIKVDEYSTPSNLYGYLSVHIRDTMALSRNEKEFVSDYNYARENAKYPDLIQKIVIDINDFIGGQREFDIKEYKEEIDDKLESIKSEIDNAFNGDFFNKKDEDGVYEPVEYKGGGDIIKSKVITINISDIIIDGWMQTAIEEVKEGKLSYTKGLPDIWYKRDGSIEISDGRHRIAEAMLNGEKEMKMKLLPTVYEDLQYKKGGLTISEDLSRKTEEKQINKMETINNKFFYRYYPNDATPFGVSEDESNRYGDGIYFIDNPYYYKDRFDNGRLVVIKPNLKNPLIFHNEEGDSKEYHDMVVSLISNGEIKNRHEFAKKMVESGYDSFVIYEPRGIYLLIFSDDKSLYDFISDTMPSKEDIDKMAVGGVISPLPFVSASASMAIKEVITLPKYNNLSETESAILYGKWKNDIDSNVWIDTDKGKFHTPFVRKLEEKSYIAQDYDAVNWDDNEFTLTEKGKDFVNAVSNRHLTRIGVKKGTDLFPDEANIQEIDVAKEKLKKSWSSIGNRE